MKIRKNHIHLFILLFAVSSLLVHSPPEAFAANGDITAVRAQSLGNNFQYDDRGRYNSLVQVDSDTYALAYAGTDSDGFISTFTISADGSTITEVESIEHDTVLGQHNSLIKVDSDTFALAYRGTDSAGFISTFTIDSDGDITPKRIQNHSAFASASANLEHDTNEGSINSLVHVNDDTYALAYERNGRQLAIATFTISSNGATITELDSKPNHATNCNDERIQSLVKVDSDTVALAYCGSGGAGTLKPFSIAENGDITAKTINNFAPSDGTDHSLVQVDSDTIALAYQGYVVVLGAITERNGVIKTFTINSEDAISEVDSLEHSSGTSATTGWNEQNSLVKVDSDTYALAYGGEPWNESDGFISTFTIDSDGNITGLSTKNQGNNLEYDTNTSKMKSLVKVDSNTVALAYQGADLAGFISTFTIGSDDIATSGGSSDDLINPKPYLTDEILVSVGPNKPIVTQSDGMSNIQIQKGDNITITLNAADDAGPALDTNTFSGQSEVESVSLYTNFGPRPNGMNLYYANHLNDQRDTSKTFYEWYKYKDDVIYDFENTVSWAEAVVTTEDKFTISITDTDTETTSSTEGKLTITFSATWDEVMPKSEIIVKAVDSKMGYSTTTLPFTLQVGEYDQSYEDLFGTSTDYRFVPLVSDIKVRESIEQWVDPFSGMTDERFVSSLGLHGDELPGYVKHLAQWVVEDKIDLADLIIAVEYIINVR
jgi:hypothetical protein